MQCAPLAQHFAHGKNRFSALLVIGGDGVQERLDLRSGGKPAEEGEFTRVSARVVPPSRA